MMSADVERQLQAVTLQPYEGTYVKSLQAPCKRCSCAEMHFTVAHFLFHGVRGRAEMNVSLKSKQISLQVSSRDRWLHAQKQPPFTERNKVCERKKKKSVNKIHSSRVTAVFICALQNKWYSKAKRLNPKTLETGGLLISFCIIQHKLMLQPQTSAGFIGRLRWS